MRSKSDPRSIGQMTGCVGWVVEPDDHQRLVSLGMVGELLVEGPNLARGYLRDTKRTAEVFIKAPIWFGEYCRRFNRTIKRVGRMYKTGDLVRYNPDGSLTFVGRKDTQIKLHGQRVELGEVEHHIRASLTGNDTPPVIAEVVTPCGSAHPLLVAFIAVGDTANQGPDPVQQAALKRWVRGLGDWLAERLPRYMVPSAYVAVDTIPLTATGKTDRRRLREIGGALTPEQLADLLLPCRSALCSPATAMERKLRGLWASVLDLPPDRISADDNFLRIGGDSILAVQLVGVARDQGLSMTVTDVFNTPRLCEMAQIVKTEGYAEETIAPFSLLPPGTDLDVAQAQAASLCGVDRNLVEDIFPCTPLQEGMIAMTSKRPGDYVRQTVLQLSGDGEAVRLERAWREAAAAIPILRTRIVDQAGKGLVQVLVAGPGTFTASQDLEAYLQKDMQEPMGLGTPPCSVWNHLQSSAGGRAYYGHSQNTLVPFQGLIRHILRTTESASEYWQNQLCGSEAVPFPSLPSPGYQPQADDVVQCRISGLQWPRNDITASTAVRAAWAILWGSTPMPVPGVERIAGPTIATVPVRVRLQWGADVQDLLHQIQTQGISMTTYEQTGLQYIRQISLDVERCCQFHSLLVVQPSARRDRTQFMVAREEGDDATWLNHFNTYAIMLECHLEEDGIQARISFDSDVMDRARVQRMAWQLEHVLREVCAQRDGPLPIRDLCGPSPEDHMELEKWNKKVPRRVSRCVHELIAERCHVQPDAPAVCAWDGDFTYGELDQLSSVLATHLIELGVGPAVFVPLCCEKSRWTTVAILGVMKAGGAFVLLDTQSRVLQFSSYGFDVSLFDSLTTLLMGGCVCVPSDAQRNHDLALAMRVLAVNFAMLTPSVLSILEPEKVPGLKAVVLGGERIPSIMVKRWSPSVSLALAYDPTECSVVSTTRTDVGPATDSCNMGYGTGCVPWIVDAQNHERLQPIGAIGELLIEGPIVGHGYLNDPDKTAAAFIDPPAWLRNFRAAHPGNPGGDRVYKTGDLVQYTADGSLRFIGRKDMQVKLRGQRIELGEVEYHTRKCFQEARDVVAEVVTPTGEGRAPMLVAFVWVNSNLDEDRVDDIFIPPTDAFRAAIPAAEVRLHDAVPVYMVPAVFLPLAAVPLTATGKTDRRRLRERAAALSRAEIESYSVSAGAKRAPATAAERTLQRLWARVLNIPPDAIGADDSFFRLGGDSLAAMQVATLSRSAGVNVSVADIFTHRKLSTITGNLPRQDSHDTPVQCDPKCPSMF
ncbi:hypothetical protein ASPSYDRAFT_94156 [Aspergillus sydowii CBS 593.65]|uniref:Carrier domain-containing protein n=1 Tax=Aspergillus sydowii CBS 593.65 TaxID=1036612 RepID=A0A1L9T2I5_9EURO|nr:uncharacterized protein ASPSYDRAFT_94156 [Aspergillus sydowii CBS 593.65]OJJ53646.1 hypothetical protein ASPSYDRAFT_94156 [Aspergillus sydowii CBS 593.65]